MDTLIAALVTGLFTGAVSWGVLRTEVKNLKDGNKDMKAAIAALHARVDVLMIALAGKGYIDSGVLAHVAREQSPGSYRQG